MGVTRWQAVILTVGPRAQEQSGAQAAQPAVAGVVVVARMPVLLDREPRNRERTGEDMQAADARHASNRAAKQKALELFATNTYRTKEEAYRIIGAQVCKAPGTIKNWIAGIQKNTPPE